MKPSIARSGLRPTDQFWNKTKLSRGTFGATLQGHPTPWYIVYSVFFVRNALQNYRIGILAFPISEHLVVADK